MILFLGSQRKIKFAILFNIENTSVDLGVGVYKRTTD